MFHNVGESSAGILEVSAIDNHIVTISRYTKDHIPVFAAQHCSTCLSDLRGSQFRASQASDPKIDQNWIICDSCYFERFYGDPNIYKAHKHCILDDSITSTGGRKICRCDGTVRLDESGKYLDLFPVREKDVHRVTAKKGGLQCPLLSLGDMVAESKYDAMQTLLGKRLPLAEEKLIATMTPEQQAKYQKGQKKSSKKEPKLQTGVIPSLVDENDRVGTEGKSAEVREAEADGDIPFFMKRYVDKYPFGNVHMALRVGPLVIENGVAQYVPRSRIPTPTNSIYYQYQEWLSNHPARTLLIIAVRPHTPHETRTSLRIHRLGGC